MGLWGLTSNVLTHRRTPPGISFSFEWRRHRRRWSRATAPKIAANAPGELLRGQIFRYDYPEMKGIVSKTLKQKKKNIYKNNDDVTRFFEWVLIVYRRKKKRKKKKITNIIWILFAKTIRLRREKSILAYGFFFYVVIIFFAYRIKKNRYTFLRDN